MSSTRLRSRSTGGIPGSKSPGTSKTDAIADRSLLVETLCRHEDRVVARDNTVVFENKRLQLPESPLRHHWVGANVRIHAYPDASLAIFHGPRLVARYDADGRLLPSRARVAASPAQPRASRRTLVMETQPQSPRRNEVAPRSGTIFGFG